MCVAACDDEPDVDGWAFGASGTDIILLAITVAAMGGFLTIVICLTC